MKVDSTGVKKNIDIASAKSRKTGHHKEIQKQKSHHEAQSASAKVDFSQQAKKINKLRQLATPDMNHVDEDRVAHFQKLIDNGEYKVDSKAVADRLVDEHLIR